ncbi:helix-turn-helix domain-containing protein [Leptospira mayottensis]|uniref:Bacteriophage CI repressor protein n=2 Tax=Leptospira mayottensis TaxID=1137606 RepID=A0AA87MQB0_9LEPT|nr:helix-turn-helix transcriptional regulator [Leptospira mayottensis]AXR64084.1 XRE family transcriptional regulator [Leptospira mayottensis]AXR64097.1 XRE family transcriptional regulator [Leptospira mayottensis]EKS01407.1 bacteriophage CI repressor protein [Leptospira mayottensis 200901122]
MDIHSRIKKLRQERDWTQEELANKIGIQQKQVSAYERGVNFPSTEILIKLAEVFDVSLDYLAFDKASISAKVEVKDRELLRYFETIDKMNEKDKNTVKEILHLVVTQKKIQELAGAK